MLLFYTVRDLALTFTQRLYCTWHVEGGSGVWQFRDITPAGKGHDKTKARSFDVLQLPGPDRLIHIGAAVVPDGNLKDGDCDVYRCANVHITDILADKDGKWRLQWLEPFFEFIRVWQAKFRGSERRITSNPSTFALYVSRLPRTRPLASRPPPLT